MSFLILISCGGGISLVIFVLANHPFCVIFPDLHQTAHIVDQVGQRDIGFCPYYSHSSEHKAAHCLLHKAEDVLNTAACL